MSRGQRLTFLAIAAAIAAVAVILLAGGSDPEQSSENAASTPTATREPAATATATATPTATARPRQPPLLQPGKERALTFEEGDTVRFRVRSNAPDEVHVHGYDILRKVTPGRTTTVSFKANITGIFEIELEQSHQLLAQLKVVP